jgi:glycerophosphoryl diester phosphodiesterase
LSWSSEILLVLFAVWQATQVLEHFRLADDVAVIAHRGSSIEAPENSLAAIERAIEEGADYLEIDVRESADGTPVLLHDRDLRRVAGVARPVSELTDAELARIDIGSRVGERYRGETVPTLDTALARAHRRIPVFVDVKAGPRAPELMRRTIETLHRHGALDGALIGASNPGPLRYAERLAPGARTVLLIHFSIGAAASPEFDVLGVRAPVVTSEFIRRARRSGHDVFVFTVNGRAEMSRFIDMGADGIITDRPALLRELLSERAALSEGQLLVVKLRHWLRN